MAEVVQALPCCAPVFCEKLLLQTKIEPKPANKLLVLKGNPLFIE
jgi:hypothetical protein